MLSRWPVVSASTVLRYSLTASMSQPTRVRIEGDDADGQQPPTEHEAEQQHRRPERRRGTGGTTDRACGRRAADRCGPPPAAPGSCRRSPCRRSAAPRPASTAGSGPGRWRRGRGSGRRTRGPGTAGRPRSPRRPARSDGPGMWMPAGVCGSIRCLPRRGLGARRRRRNVQTRMRTTRTRMRIGSSAMIAPQSGMTNCAVSSRMPVQRSSSIAGRQASSVVRGAGDEDVGHDRHGHAKEQQHRRAGVVDVPATDRRDRPEERRRSRRTAGPTATALRG